MHPVVAVSLFGVASVLRLTILMRSVWMSPGAAHAVPTLSYARAETTVATGSRESQHLAGPNRRGRRNLNGCR
jgi:hypothetical protein